ncbi:hypothetical protein BH23GEM8_BH23GEM8_09800 [soil metagenome]
MAQSPVVLITGSTSGLGRELALELGATGAHVIVHGRNAQRGQEVVAEIEQRGGTAHTTQPILPPCRRCAASERRSFETMTGSMS